MLQNTKLIIESKDIERSFPKNIIKNDEVYFASTIKGHAKETFIKRFKNISINNELFMKERFRLRIMMESFGDTWQDGVYNKFLYQVKSYTKNLLRTKRNIDKALWCFDQFSTGGYFHWITEIGPRLWVANEHVDISVPLLVPEYFFQKWNFGEALLKPFNRKVITFKENEVIFVKDLTFIGQTGGVFNYQPLPIHSSVKVLKDFYLKNEIGKSTLKIYISRNRTGKRMILNEDKMLPLLKENGYEIVYTEELSLDEQINLFTKATHLLSPHGAGLSNMVFMHPQTKVIEIRHQEENHMLNFFHALAHTFNIDYFYIFGNNQGDSLPNEKRPEDKSMHVNIEMLDEVLKKAN